MLAVISVWMASNLHSLVGRYLISILLTPTGKYAQSKVQSSYPRYSCQWDCPQSVPFRQWVGARLPERRKLCMGQPEPRLRHPQARIALEKSEPAALIIQHAPSPEAASLPFREHFQSVSVEHPRTFFEDDSAKEGNRGSSLERGIQQVRYQQTEEWDREHEHVGPGVGVKGEKSHWSKSEHQGPERLLTEKPLSGAPTLRHFDAHLRRFSQPPASIPTE